MLQEQLHSNLGLEYIHPASIQPIIFFYRRSFQCVLAELCARW